MRTSKSQSVGNLSFSPSNRRKSIEVSKMDSLKSTSKNRRSSVKLEYLEDQKNQTSIASLLRENETKSDLQGSSQIKSSKDCINSVSSNMDYLKVNVRTPEGESVVSSFQIRGTDKSLTHSSDTQSDDSKAEDSRSNLYKRSHSLALTKKSEEIRRSNSLGDGYFRVDTKEPLSASFKSSKDDHGLSFSSDNSISKIKKLNELRRSDTRSSLSSKTATISLPFDAFVDQIKGYDPVSIASTYPSYKIDKRLIFLGKEVDYPWHVISYHSTFRKLWNIFIIGIIIYQVFWYPTAVAFIYGEPWPTAIHILELVLVCISFVDILINIRTTFSNQNNEEIIDGKMMRNNYFRTRLFLIDVITTIPLPEILRLLLLHSQNQWTVYSLVSLVRMLRCLKVSVYLQNRTMGVFSKLLRIFITFFIIVHWASCIWYIVLKLEYPDQPSVQNVWFPNNLRMIAEGEDLMYYYNGMDIVQIYGFTLLSVFMLAVGSDMAPVTNIQIWMSVFIGLFGAVSVAYIFGLVTIAINRANEESQLHQQQLEELKHKLKVNKIPHNLRIKVMEYFNYSWRKHSVLKKTDDFSELSLPLQRDIALYQYQGMIMNVPLFKELDPVELLSIVQKLKTSIYMPGDKIVREGERGNEMFFVQEGIAEMLIKKHTLTKQKTDYEKIFLEKGDYFGEVALISNSKRTFEVSAFEFCILNTFSRSDYDNLSGEFKDIGPRLRSGLKHYKNTRMSQLVQILGNLDIFQNFTENELQQIGDEYLEEIFVDPDRVILAPKNRTNAIYIMVGGNVHCYNNDNETKNYIRHLKRSENKTNWTFVEMDEQKNIDCLDDDILHLEKDKLSMDDHKNRLSLARTYGYGEYFGTLDFEVNEVKCDKFYLSESGCQIGAITQSLKAKMAIQDPDLFEKLRKNVVRISPARTMMPIEEEDDSSFTTKTGTIKLKASRRQSIFSDEPRRRSIFLRPNWQNKDEELFGIGRELQTLEEEMNHFRSLITLINTKLGNAGFSGYSLPKSKEISPNTGKSKPKSQVFSHTVNHLRETEKPASAKDIMKVLADLEEK